MKWTRELIIKELKEILLSANEGQKEAIENCTEASNLAFDLGLTSIGILYVVIIIEETFGIRFDDVGTGDFATLGDVVNYIEAKVK